MEKSFMYQFILTEIDNQIFHLILNREDKRNALHQPMMEEIDHALDEAEKAYNNGEARVLFLRSEGRAFSSGIDLTGFDGYIELFGEAWQQNLFGVTRLLQNILTKIERSSLPSICLMHGYCLGMGLEMALACDFRIVAERTKLSLPETRLGIVPDVGGTVRLVKLIGPSRAKEVILTGGNVDLDKAEKWGMVNYVVPREALLDKANELAQELKLSAPLAVNYAKRVINDIADVQRGLHIEAWAQAALFRSEDFVNGVQAILTKTYPVEWKGK
jgi:enoyl-CoA hydratase/carnithine racemase